MKLIGRRDFLAGLFLIVVGGGFAIGATHYNFGVAAKPGPGYFPFGLGVILALLGAVVLVGAIRERAEDAPHVGQIPWRPLLGIVGALLLFGFLLPRLGFVISFPLMIVVTALGGHEFRWRDALLNAAILTVFSYLVFIAGLKLTIPVWPVWPL